MFVQKKLVFLFTACLAMGTALQAGTLSTPAVDAYNARVGTETFAALYKFTTNTALVETAEAMTNMGSDVIKLYMGSDASGQSGVTLPSNVTNLITLARNCPSYEQVLAMPFRHFIMWAYPFANSDEWWGSGYNTTGGAKDYREMYDLTCYLLTNFNNSGKTFYLGHWEGDGYLEVNGWTTNPAPATISGMIGWLNNRQQAVDDAKAATAFTNVNVFNYAECNRVRDAMNNGTNNNQRVINYVVPYVTNLDYLSYSSYDAQNLSSSDLYTTLNYMQAHLPANKASLVPGVRMWIGEYGWGYESTAAQEAVTRPYIQRLLGWNYNGQCLPYILIWEMYSNYNPNGATNYCLIDYTGNKVPCYYLHYYFINRAKLLVAQFNESTGALPTDTQFSSMVSPMLNAVLTAPVNLTLSSVADSPVGGTSAFVSATLAQGVYGDDQAVVSVFWGPQNGGANSSAWASQQVIGVNTNFNPVAFTAMLANLLPGTNYYIAFCASNASAQVWAAAPSIVGGVLPPQLNPANYACHASISFPGYQGAPLADFPALIALSPSNVPGLAYNQFQTKGSDLRFTDSTGTGMLPYEIDEWNTNGLSTVWVQVPLLNGANIWAYWGNPADTDVPPASSNLWLDAGYQIVYHLKESAFPFVDSTGQHPAITGVAPSPATGVAGHGALFNGTSDYITPGHVTLSNQFTAYAWINIAPSAVSEQSIWVNQVGGYGSNGFSWYVDSYNTSDRIAHFDSGTGTGGAYVAADPSAGTAVPSGWHFMVSTWDQVAGRVTNYLDANMNGAGTAVANFGLTNQLNLGAFLNPTLFFNGTMDEARVQGGIASTNWIWATYSNMANPGSFVSYSSLNFGLPQLVQDIAPLSQTVEAYSGLGTVSYSVMVSGSPPFAYQWYQDGTGIVGATNSSYTFTALAGTNTYYVQVTNAATATLGGGNPLTSSTATVIGSTVLATTNYACRMKISFPGYSGSQTLTNFPALVQLSNGMTGFSYAQFASPTGGDLRFTDGSGLIPLPHEINQWNPNGVSSVWVQVPALAASNTYIWAYWGNPAATNPPAWTTNGTVWQPTYLLVWHLEQSGLPYQDSAALNPAVSGVAPGLVTGEIGSGGFFNGTSSYLHAGPVNLGSAFTLFAWAKVAAGATNIQTIWANAAGGWNSAGFSLFVNAYNTANQELLLQDGDGVGGDSINSANNTVTPGVWHCIAAAVNRTAGTGQLYVDGVNVANGSVVNDLANTAGLDFGRFTNSVYYFDGDLDEARIASGVCSSNWISATSLNVASNSAFTSSSPVNPSPALSAANSTSGPVLTWPASSGVFIVYTTTNLTPPAVWVPATNAASYVNGQWQSPIVPPGNGAQFYRLQAR
jgi:hypothetical protein